MGRGQPDRPSVSISTYGRSNSGRDTSTAPAISRTRKSLKHITQLFLILSPSRPTQRGVGHRHERGAGCGGRGSVLRATGSQGGFFESVSDHQASGREMQSRTAKSCGPDAPTLASSSRSCVGPTGLRQNLSADDGGKRARSPGRARHKPLKPLRAGMPGDSGVLVVTRVRSTNTKCTRDRGCSGHPAFPTPSMGREINALLGRIAPRGREVASGIRATSLRANRSRECAPDDRLREAIHVAAKKEWIACAPGKLALSCR